MYFLFSLTKKKSYDNLTVITIQKQNIDNLKQMFLRWLHKFIIDSSETRNKLITYTSLFFSSPTHKQKKNFICFFPSPYTPPSIEPLSTYT